MAHGVRTIADLQARCVIDEITGCWNWAGAYNSARGGNNPVTYLPRHERVFSCMRAALLLTRFEKEPEKLDGLRVWAKCWNRKCCNPEHCRSGTTAQHGAAISKAGHQKGRASRILANTKSGRKKSKLSAQLVLEIRASGLNGTEVARKFGLKKSQAYRVLNGQVWPEVAPAASVFSWRPE